MTSLPMPELDAVRQIILPKIVAAKARFPIRRLRIWSAGCSTGEEPYTLSMMMQEESQQLHDWTVEIFATDLSERSLAHALAASHHSTNKNISALSARNCSCTRWRGSA
jgi:chemotaxis protein methyltransferase CheR